VSVRLGLGAYIHQPEEIVSRFDRAEPITSRTDRSHHDARFMTIGIVDFYLVFVATDLRPDKIAMCALVDPGF
jgi:hypothetical protein